jgi:hypothetical protein
MSLKSEDGWPHWMAMRVQQQGPPYESERIDWFHASCKHSVKFGMKDQ